MTETWNDILGYFAKYPGVQYFFIALVIFGLAILLSKVLRNAMNRYMKRSSKTLNVDPTKFSFFKNALRFIIFLVAGMIVFYSIPPLRSLGVTLFAGAGIITAILAFASQAAFSNIISGIFIVIFQPFRVGDLIKIGEIHAGKVVDITLRHTVINNFENRRIIIPNSIISSETIINSTIDDLVVCAFIEIGISYDSDVNLAMEIMREEAMKHPNCIDNRSEESIELGDPQVVVRVLSFGDSSVNLRAWAWAEDSGKAFVMKCDLLKSIKERFDSEGVEIPFPYRTLVFKNQADKDTLDNQYEDTKD